MWDASMDAMITIPEHAPLDDLGRLLHEDDYPAQLALALARLEATLARTGRHARDLRELRVRTTDGSAFAAARDVLDERLAAIRATPTTTVVEVADIPPPGALVALGATLHDHPLHDGPLHDGPRNDDPLTDPLKDKDLR